MLGKAAAVPDVERGDDRAAGVVLDRDRARVAVVLVDEMRERDDALVARSVRAIESDDSCEVAFWLQSSGARASSPARKGMTSSRSSGRRSTALAEDRLGDALREEARVVAEPVDRARVPSRAVLAEAGRCLRHVPAKKIPGTDTLSQ